MKEFNFDNVGKRLPYSVPEQFFEGAKRRALSATTAVEKDRRGIFYRVAIAAAVVVAVCGTAVWLEVYRSPERQYDRLLAQTSTDVLWEYTCEYEMDTENDIFY